MSAEERCTIIVRAGAVIWQPHTDERITTPRDLTLHDAWLGGSGTWWYVERDGATYAIRDSDVRGWRAIER